MLNVVSMYLIYFIKYILIFSFLNILPYSTLGSVQKNVNNLAIVVPKNTPDIPIYLVKIIDIDTLRELFLFFQIDHLLF